MSLAHLQKTLTKPNTLQIMEKGKFTSFSSASSRSWCKTGSMKGITNFGTDQDKGFSRVTDNTIHFPGDWVSFRVILNKIRGGLMEMSQRLQRLWVPACCYKRTNWPAIQGQTMLVFIAWKSGYGFDCSSCLWKYPNPPWACSMSTPYSVTSQELSWFCIVLQWAWVPRCHPTLVLLTIDYL